MANEIKVDMRIGVGHVVKDGEEAGRKAAEAANRGAKLASRNLATVLADMRSNMYEFVGPKGNQRLVPKGGGGAPPIIPPPVASSAGGASPFGGGKGLSALSVSGIPYISTLARAALSPVGMAAAAAGIAILAMRSAVHRMTEEAQRSAKIYARAAMGGKPIGFAVSQNSLANVLGVSEEDVMQFGKVLGMLNTRLAYSQKILTETNPSLTMLSWRFQILKTDMAASGAAITDKLQPAILGLIDSMTTAIKKGTGILADIIDEFKANTRSQRAYQFAENFVKDAGITTKDRTAKSETGTEYKTGEVDFYRQGSDKPDEGIQRAFKRYMEKNYGEGKKEVAPELQGNSMRLPASTLEKMGLVIGNGPSQNHAAKTERNTAGILEQMRALNDKVQPGGGLRYGAPANAL